MIDFTGWSYYAGRDGITPAGIMLQVAADVSVDPPIPAAVHTRSLSDPEVQDWLQSGGVPLPIPELTPEEKKAEVTAKISTIESANLMPRALRDMILKDSANPAYARTKAIDDNIAALRTAL